MTDKIDLPGPANASRHCAAGRVSLTSRRFRLRTASDLQRRCKSRRPASAYPGLLQQPMALSDSASRFRSHRPRIDGHAQSIRIGQFKHEPLAKSGAGKFR